MWRQKNITNSHKIDKREQRRQEKENEKIQKQNIQNLDNKRKKLNPDEILHSNPILQNKKLICFDLYGTLIHYPHSHEQLRDTFKSIWIAPMKKLGKIAQTTDIDILSANEKVKGFKMPQFVVEKLKEHISDNVKNTLLYPETLQILNKLKEKGYSLALISNLSKEYEEPLRKLIPDWLFDYEALSFKVWATKPKNKIFKHIKREAGVDYPDMVMIWDIKRLDVDWPKKSWIDAIWLNRREKEMNYDKKKNLITISTLSDLLQILGIE